MSAAELRVEELTPRGSGGVSVLRLSGAGARRRAEELAGRELPFERPSLVRLRLGDEDLDEALVLVEGEERVELHVHGSPPLVERLRLEFEGEFGAPAHGLLPDGSLEERARALLASAPGEAGARILLDQAEGALRRRLEAWAHSDDASVVTDARALARESLAARYALEPARVVLAGPANAGKSTLFNALLGRRRVVVDAGAGTTRDVVRERASLAGWPVELVDTAGLRELAGEAPATRIESLGQELARRVASEADLVLWLRPAGEQGASATPPPRPAGAAPWVELRTLGDLVEEGTEEALSALRDPEGALRAVEEAFRAALELSEPAWVAGRGSAFDAASRAAVLRLEGLAPAAARRGAADFLAGVTPRD